MVKKIKTEEKEAFKTYFDMRRRHVWVKVEACERFRQSDHALQLPHSDAVRALAGVPAVALAQLVVKRHQLLTCGFREARMDLILGIVEKSDKYTLASMHGARRMWRTAAAPPLRWAG